MPKVPFLRGGGWSTPSDRMQNFVFFWPRPTEREAAEVMILNSLHAACADFIEQRRRQQVHIDEIKRLCRITPQEKT